MNRIVAYACLALSMSLVGEAFYAVIGKKLTGVLSPKRITALINLWSFALITLLGLWMAWSFDFARVAPPMWLLLLFYSLAASVWTVWLWMTGLKTIPANQAGVFAVCCLSARRRWASSSWAKH